MSLPMPVSDLDVVTACLRRSFASESGDAARLSASRRRAVVAAIAAAVQLQATVAADHPRLFANLRLRGVHVEHALKISTDNRLGGAGRLFRRRVALGGAEIRRLFELAAGSSLQQRSEVATPVHAADNKRPRKNQVIMKKEVFTLVQSSRAAPLAQGNASPSLAVITVAANAHKPDEMPLMRLVERQGGPRTAQLPCGPEEHNTFHFLYADADADMSQLEIEKPVSLCTHGRTKKHDKGEGKNHHACHRIDAYRMVEKGFTRDAYGAWSQTLNSNLVQQLLVASNGAAAASAAADEESDAEGESDGEDDVDEEWEGEDDTPPAAARASFDGLPPGSLQSNKRAWTDSDSSAAAAAAHSAASSTCVKRRRQENGSQTQQAAQSAAAASPLLPRGVVKPSPISLPAELAQPLAPIGSWYPLESVAAAAAPSPSNLLHSPSPSVAPAIALWEDRVDASAAGLQSPLQSSASGQSDSQSQSQPQSSLGSPTAAGENGFQSEPLFSEDDNNGDAQANFDLDSDDVVDGFLSPDEANYAPKEPPRAAAVAAAAAAPLYCDDVAPMELDDDVGAAPAERV